MAFELLTTATVSNTSYPSVSDISVRFYFANGTASENPLTAYPLFGQENVTIPYTTFVDKMNAFAIGDQTAWCKACGNSTGVCADSTASSGSSSTSSSDPSASGSGGMSKAVAGVIGAMVTLAVILGLEALVLLAGGLRVVSKKRLAGAGAAASTGATVEEHAGKAM
jgi:hypothetical protein